ncbi:hypothetical protein HF234_003734 [Salmonella enterica]|nr:hypothetical protein [Salmonella enterica]
MKTSKYALLVASGLMVSAGAMAAAQTITDTPVPGTVNIDGTIVNATCSIDVPVSAVSFEASKADIDKAVPHSIIDTVPLHITVNNCANQGVKFSAVANMRDESDGLSPAVYPGSFFHRR